MKYFNCPMSSSVTFKKIQNVNQVFSQIHVRIAYLFFRLLHPYINRSFVIAWQYLQATLAQAVQHYNELHFSEVDHRSLNYNYNLIFFSAYFSCLDLAGPILTIYRP
jgi:hypothetical protein